MDLEFIRLVDLGLEALVVLVPMEKADTEVPMEVEFKAVMATEPVMEALMELVETEDLELE